MVDALLSFNETRSTSQLFIEKENIFCNDGIFHEPGLIENIAQTAALAAGYHAKEKNKPVEIGFIGAVKHLKIHRLPKINETLITSIHVLNNVLNASIIRGEIQVINELIAECEMTIFTGE